MPLPWFKNSKLSPKSAPWIVGAFVMVFAIVSLGVLVSDVTRDDVLALHQGYDGTRIAQAEVGSFIEVSEDGVGATLCGDQIENGDVPMQKNVKVVNKDVVVVNKLGETLPILTDGLSRLFRPDNGGKSKVTHVVNWQITDISVTLDTLGKYSRDVMNAGGQCGQFIDERTRNRHVRICLVHRVWKNADGQTMALFFDPLAINGCRNAQDCTDNKCPRVIDDGQVWTAIKMKLDLIEVSGV